jgi:energy-coupling factor transporter ATP-binding protein EcfA2
MSGLIVESVTKQFPTRTEPLVVLRETNLRLTAGQNVAILGPSGSGKSTLLHILGTLDHPTSGSVELDGTNPFQLDERHLAGSATGTSASSSRTITYCPNCRRWKTCWSPPSPTAVRVRPRSSVPERCWTESDWATDWIIGRRNCPAANVNGWAWPGR